MATGEQARQWLEARRDIVLDVVRVYLGIALIAKGLAFGFHKAEIADLSQLGWAAGFAAQYVIPVHLFGGLLLAFGLVTRAAALLNVPILLGAVLFVHGREGLFTSGGSLELDLLVLFLLVLFSLVGAGRLSLDYYLEQHASRPASPSRQPRPSQPWGV